MADWLLVFIGSAVPRSSSMQQSTPLARGVSSGRCQAVTRNRPTPVSCKYGSFPDCHCSSSMSTSIICSSHLLVFYVCPSPFSNPLSPILFLPPLSSHLLPPSLPFFSSPPSFPPLPLIPFLSSPPSFPPRLPKPIHFTQTSSSTLASTRSWSPRISSKTHCCAQHLISFSLLPSPPPPLSPSSSSFLLFFPRSCHFCLEIPPAFSSSSFPRHTFIVHSHRRAVKCFQKAVDLQPSYTEAAICLGDVLFAMGDEV